MKPRSQRPAEERHARSRAVRHIADAPLLRGNLVSVARTCGKAGCRCLKGAKHVSLYLVVRQNNSAKMIYVPRALENTVRDWVENAREVKKMLDVVYQHGLAEFLRRKEAHFAERKAAGARSGKTSRQGT